MDDFYIDKQEPWVRHKTSTVERRLSTVEDISSAEDLIEGTHGYGFDEDLGTWAFEVISTHGYPRFTLGVVIIRGDASGALTIWIEGDEDGTPHTRA